MQNPVIVVPGITASELRDEYPIAPENVWTTVLKKDFERITLHPDDRRYERNEPARIRPEAVFDPPYGELISELRHNLTLKADKPVPVYPFAYDWRMPLKQTVEELNQLIDEVVDRTRLMRHYGRNYQKNAKVDLVGHSMGGLVIAGYLAAHGDQKRIGKVATLGTPFQGSYEAPIKVLTGTASLGTPEAGSREREAARITPALYHLVPRFSVPLDNGAVPAVVDQNGQAVDLFDAGTWQDGVVDSLAEFIRLYSVDRASNLTERRTRATKLLQEMLNDAKDFLAETDKLKLAKDVNDLSASDWLCIAGVDTDTRIRLRLVKDRFSLSSDDRKNRWGKDVDPILTGDGTVPLAGAVPTFLQQENVVCVRPSDLGYWEVGDRALLGPVGFHGLLPKVNLIQRLVVTHLRGRSGQGNDSVWGCSMPGVTAAQWKPAISKLQWKQKQK